MNNDELLKNGFKSGKGRVIYWNNDIGEGVLEIGRYPNVHIKASNCIDPSMKLYSSQYVECYYKVSDGNVETTNIKKSTKK